LEGTDRDQRIKSVEPDIRAMVNALHSLI